MNAIAYHWAGRAEKLLLVISAACLLLAGGISAQAVFAKRQSQNVSSAGSSKTSLMPVGVRSAEVLGRIEIPTLKVAVPLMADDQASSLRVGAGHIPGTAAPGGLGTVGIAAHRDTFFRPIREIRPGTEIRLVDRNGVFHYEVDSTEIVKPNQTEVLDDRNRPGLTLVTCYPFHYVGAAPLRFIVHAHLLSVIPDSN